MAAGHGGNHKFNGRWKSESVRELVVTGRELVRWRTVYSRTSSIDAKRVAGLELSRNEALEVLLRGVMCPWTLKL